MCCPVVALRALKEAPPRPQKYGHTTTNTNERLACQLLRSEQMNRVFGKKKAPGPPPPSLGEASSGVGSQIASTDGEYYLF